MIREKGLDDNADSWPRHLTSYRDNVSLEKDDLNIKIDAQRQLLKTVLENVPAGIAFFSGNELKVKWANQVFRRFLEQPYRSCDITGLKLDEIMPGAEEGGLANIFRKVIETGLPRIEYEYEHTGFGRGLTYWRCSLQPVPSGMNGERDIMVLATEITRQVIPRQKVEELAVQAEANLAKLQAVVTSMKEGLIISDMEGNILTMNPSALNIHGFHNPDGEQCHFGDFYKLLEFYYMDGVTVVKEQWPLDRVLKGETFCGVNFRVKRKDTGVERSCNYNGTPVLNSYGEAVLAILTMHDVTKELKIEKQLQKYQNHLEELVKERTNKLRAANERLSSSEERFSKVFYSSPIMMTVSSLLNDRYIDVNDAFLNVTGYSSEEVLGRTSRELKIIDGDLNHSDMKSFLEKNGEIKNHEVEFYSKEGELRVGLVSSEIIEVDGEHCLLCAIKDITEHKHFHKEMFRLDRLNLIGEMAAGIGHEIRNPMTTAKGFMQWLGSKPECIKYKEYFDLATGELDRANSIITEYLSMAKNRTLNLKVQNLNSVINKTFSLIQADAMLLNKNVYIKMDEIPDLLIDEKEITQLILNLTRNGFEAMDADGTLTIKTFRENQEVVLAVQDEGSGIEPDIIDKLGTPFFTTKDYGTGLGLAVCYSVAARHNAIIKIETGGAGTTFFVRFKL